MSCNLGYVDEFSFVRWFEPTVEDAWAVGQGIRERAKELGRKLRHFVILGEQTASPDEKSRAALRESLDETLEHLDSMYVIIEGRGLKRALMRTLVTNTILLSRYRGRVSAHDSVRKAFEKIDLEDPARVESIIQRAAAAELLNPGFY